MVVILGQGCLQGLAGALRAALWGVREACRGRCRAVARVLGTPRSPNAGPPQARFRRVGREAGRRPAKRPRGPPKAVARGTQPRSGVEAASRGLGWSVGLGLDLSSGSGKEARGCKPRTERRDSRWCSPGRHPERKRVATVWGTMGTGRCKGREARRNTTG